MRLMYEQIKKKKVVWEWSILFNVHAGYSPKNYNSKK